MLWFLLAIGLAIVASAIGSRFEVKRSNPYGYSYRSDSYRTIAPDAFWFTFVPLMIIAIFLNFYLYSDYKVREETYHVIQNIGDSNGTEGSSSLFGGSIENQPVYMYYIQNERGEFRLRHVDADRAYITYSDETPKIVYHRTYSSNSWISVNPRSDVPNAYEFRVPRGSVKQSFNLDAQ